MRALKFSKFGLVLGSILFLTVFVPSVLAVGKPTSLPQQANRLAGTNLRSCQAREAAIKIRLAHLIQLATMMETKFDVIAGRVEDYYTTKVLPEKTVANYSTLVADITASKKTVQTGLDKARGDVAGFACDGSDPKAQMTTFRLDMQGVIQKLKDYRTSIKNLIVAVHSSPTPTP